MNAVFKHAKSTVLVALMAASTLLTLTACDQDRLAGCEGDIVVENEIPDLILYLEGESYIRDLVHDQPPVFRHTRNEKISITARAVDFGSTVRVLNRINNEMNSRTIIEIQPLNVGNTVVSVIAEDDCFDRIRSTTFKVTVLYNDEEFNN